MNEESGEQNVDEEPISASDKEVNRMILLGVALVLIITVPALVVMWLVM